MKQRLRIGLLLAAIVIVYCNTLANQFTMDDGLYVVNNPQVTAPSLHALFSVNPVSGVFRPLTFATFAFNWALGGNVPVGYHLVNRLLHAGVTWLLYLLLLTILGAFPQAKATAFAAALLAAVAALAGLLWLAWKRQGAWVLAGGIYLAAFATTANILLPTGTIMGERLAYLPSAGFCLLLALGWNWLRERQRAVAWAMLTAVVLMLSVRTVIRNRDWKNNFTLYSAAVRAAPASVKMHSNLGGEYLARNHLDLARRQYQAAPRTEPNYPDALSSYGLVEYRLGNYQAAGALMEEVLNMSDGNNPNYDSMTVDYAQVLAQTHHIDAALDILNQEIPEAPPDTGARGRLAPWFVFRMEKSRRPSRVRRPLCI